MHDYLNQRGGAERVFRHVADLYADAPVYTSILDVKATGDLVDPARVRTSALQRIPGAGRFFRFLAPLYPAAFERFDLSAFDLIVSTTTAWAKGVRVPAGAIHVSYVHTPSRFAFDYERYVGGFGIGAIARPIVGRLVAWDRCAAQRPTALIANSANVAERIKTYYGRDSYVVPCPVDVERFAIGAGNGDYFLVVSRLLAYKRIDIAIEACRLAGVRLLIVGEGPARRELETRAAGSQTVFVGSLSDDKLRAVMGEARAVIVPGEEDFGLVPLEANASGRPAIAYGRGGALETIVAGATGEYFMEPVAASLAPVLGRFDATRYDRTAMRAHAEFFAPERFKERFAAAVARVVRLGSRAAVDADLRRVPQQREGRADRKRAVGGLEASGGAGA